MGAFVSFGIVLLVYAVAGQIATARGTGSEQDYLVGGRSSGRYLVALSAGAAATSGFAMIGGVGSGYTMGVVAVLIPVAWFIGDLLFWSLFPARIHRLSTDTGCTTVPALLAVTSPDRSTLSVRSLAGWCIVIFVSLYASSQLLAAGKTLRALFPVSLSWGIVISTVIIIIYCARGGLRASIWTNALQGIMILATTVGMLLLIVVKCGGVAAIVRSLAAHYPELLNPLHVSGTWILLGLFLAGFTFAALGFDLSTPQLLVRVMAGRDAHEAAAAKWYYLAFIQITWITMAIFGMVAHLALPHIADPEQALPVYATAHLPPWLVGLVIAGIFSAIVSTLEAQVLVISSSLSVDIAPKVHKHLLSRFGTRLDMVVTVIVGVMLAAITLSISATVFQLIVFSTNILAAAFGPVILVVLFNLRTTPMSLKVAMVTGMFAAILWCVTGLNHIILEALPGMLAGLVGYAVAIRVSSLRRNA